MDKEYDMYLKRADNEQPPTKARRYPRKVIPMENNEHMGITYIRVASHRNEWKIAALDRIARDMLHHNGKSFESWAEFKKWDSMGKSVFIESIVVATLREVEERLSSPILKDGVSEPR